MDSFTIAAIGDGWYLVDDGTERWRVAVAADRDAQWVFVEGQVAVVDTPKPGRRRASSGEAGVMSPMPATVVAVHAAPGQQVSEGDTLLVLEAMKMEMPVRAPRSGVIRTVSCAKGDLVQPGVNLLEFE